MDRTTRREDYGHLKLLQDGGGRHLGFIRTVYSIIRSAVPENPTLAPYGHLKFFQDGGGLHLGFVLTENSAIRSAVPENPIYNQT